MGGDETPPNQTPEPKKPKTSKDAW
jgi:hypothetical protein